MTPTQTVQLVAIISEIWPSMKLGSHTPDAWHTVLGDLPYADAVAAVQHLARTRGGYIAPADIRRQVAAAAGLLAPNEAEALADAAEVAGRQGLGAMHLHPVTYEAYRAMGGPTAFDAPASVIRPQWARVYAAVVTRHEDALLTGDLGTAIRQRRAIAPAP